MLADKVQMGVHSNKHTEENATDYLVRHCEIEKVLNQIQE